jgi:hypothetical protein
LLVLCLGDSRAIEAGKCFGNSVRQSLGDFHYGSSLILECRMLGNTGYESILWFVLFRMDGPLIDPPVEFCQLGIDDGHSPAIGCCTSRLC